jgi:SAM-dependent methyltransferase
MDVPAPTEPGHRPAAPAPSAWVRRWAGLIRPGGQVLDVACGSGRHLRWLAAQGFDVTGVDRDAQAVAPLQSLGEILVADVENGPWPFAGRRFDGVVVTNYLWRPLLPALVACVADAGVLIYETFASGNETVGKPSRPDFLLRPGELIAAARGLRIVAYEDGLLREPERFVQRIAAVRESGHPDGTPPRYPLEGLQAR